MKFEEGAVAVPTEPGLGVELDRKALAHLHENYLKCGLTKRDDQTEMQKIHPDWEFKAVRW
jgi:glucarate dehydratase